MPDKKLTDSEIVKVLECFVNEECPDCEHCSCYDYCRKKRDHIDTLDLINRQKAEIERLKEVNNSFTDIGKLYSEIKAEAYEEFAEKLKEIAISRYDAFDEQEYPSVKLTDLDNLLKELVGEDK